MRRDEHCAFAHLNANGKCIADCVHNILENYDRDCIGNTGKTMDGNKEVKLFGVKPVWRN